MDTLNEIFFSFDGRLNRKPYIFRFWLRNIIIWFLGFLISSLFDPEGKSFNVMVFALTFISALSCFSLYVRRLHDLDHSAWMLILSFVPMLSFFFGIYLMFFRGTVGPNAYGPDPLADGKGISIL